ncbi:MAG: helix-turn-helix domain-containing protein [Clostridia bacterium]|nr:helix-turn-helix domain-containing protein [Clostridia bacterium]
MDILSNIAENLKDLLIEHNLNAKTLSNNLGFANANITRYINKDRVPTVENLVKIADYFKCSTDYLLGLEDEIYPQTFLPCPPFSERLAFLLKYFKSSAYNLYHNNGITQSKYYSWKNGVTSPSLENVIKLAKIFDCSVDFVIGRSKV